MLLGRHPVIAWKVACGVTGGCISFRRKTIWNITCEKTCKHHQSDKWVICHLPCMGCASKWMCVCVWDIAGWLSPGIQITLENGHCSIHYHHAVFLSWPIFTKKHVATPWHIDCTQGSQSQTSQPLSNLTIQFWVGRKTTRFFSLDEL